MLRKPPPQVTKAFRDLCVLIFVLLAVCVMWYSAWQWIDKNITVPVEASSIKNQAGPKADTTAEEFALRGQFGDKFGAVNALFSGFAFATIIFTIFLQRRDLRETHQAMANERFDSTFFQLLQVHITIAEKVVLRSGFVGHQAFKAFNDQFISSDPDFAAFGALQKLDRDQIRLIIDNGKVSRELFPALDDADVSNLIEARASGVSAFNNHLDTSMEMHERKVIAAYTKASSAYIDEFSHYFRNLYHLLKFIDESDTIFQAEKVRYSRFVRSQLSQVELVAIFYNCVSKIELPGREKMELGHPKMGRLVQRYDLLQNLNPRGLMHPIHKEIFEQNYPKDKCHAN